MNAIQRGSVVQHLYKRYRTTINRHLRIMAVLTETQGTLNIPRLTRAVNDRFKREYSPMIIQLDLTKLVGSHQVATANGKTFSATDQGRKMDLSSLKEEETASLPERQLMAA